MREFKIVRNAANIDRLYLKRSMMGRGLLSLVDKAEIMLLNLHNHLVMNQETTTILDQEKEQATQLSSIRDYLQIKYELEMVNITPSEVVKSQLKVRLDRIASKRMHNVLYTNEEENIDFIRSSFWLLKGNTSPQTEGLLTKFQDRNIYFGTGSKCQHCRTGPKSVDHLATNCGRLLNFEYKKKA